jgi:GNAT superfamily N-acetyltransferase
MNLITVSGSALLDQFIRLPFRLYRDDPRWVPPLISAEKKMLDPNRNPFYDHSEAAHFLVEKDGVYVGRISAIDNKLHNQVQQQKTGFWGYFESENDPAISGMLFDAAADWLRTRGLNRMLGPVNPSINDPSGLLVDGFEWSPFVLMTYNPRFYVSLVEQAGFTKAMDLLAYIITHQSVDHDRVDRIAQLIQKRSKASIRPFDLSKIDRELDIVKDVYNDAWEKNWGFVPMTEAEVRFQADDLKSILLEEFAYIAEVDGRPVGFAFALPDINLALKKCNGSLLPFGWRHFTKSALRSKIKTLRLVALGLRKAYHTSGIGTLFYQRIIAEGLKRDYTAAECSWILETNDLMKSPIVAMGGNQYKTYRLYDKPI